MSFLRDLVWQQHLYEERASVAHQIARYALALDHRDLPDDVVHQAKRCLLDALGCALGSRESPACKTIEDTIVEIGGAAESPVIGSGLRPSALNAALANAAL